MRLICALSIVFVLGATPAFADPVKPKVIQPCKLVTTAGGGQICGYTLDEWKAVLVFDEELFSKRDLLAKEKKKTAALALQVENLKSQVGVYASSQSLLVERTNKLTKDLIDLDLKFQNERVKPTWGSPLAWTVAAVATAILAGVVVKGLVD